MIFKFFKKTKQNENNNLPSFEMELTASVLAYEIARSDGNVSSDELSVLMEEIEIIAEKVGKEKSEILQIVKNHSENSVSFYEFIEDINKNYSKGQKLSLIKFLWKTAYADGRLDVDEERLVRRVADLIKIKHLDVLKLKDLLKN
tara:strand:+ start:1717 stop:2151 length:435 start_codon:yes stop_codon:yes gene_type:complete